VRLAYIIPSNRTAQADAVAKIRAIITDSQDWYRDQFERHGFGAKTFRIETETDGVTPKVHVKNIPETDAYLRDDIWGRTIQAASNAGITTWTTGEVWLLVPEAHVQAADGVAAGGFICVGEYRVNHRLQPAADHGDAERARNAKMLPIAFADGARVSQKNAVDHLLCLLS
jgi:hypothetical protein